MLQKLFPYRFIILISIIGFFCSGVFAIPFYVYWWDSDYTFTKFSIENLPPTNWMGWFYVYFWDFLYQITGSKASIGVFHNLAYWISMPTLYINFFEMESVEKKNNIKVYTLWFVLLVFNPVIFGFFMGITNNVLVASFVLIVLAIHSTYIKTMQKKWLWINLFVLLVMILIRRDSLILALPILLFTSYLLTNRKLVLTIILTVIAISGQQLVDKFIINQIPHYNEYQSKQLSINTEGIVISYDLFAMGYYKNELLFPDSVLAEKYQGTNREMLQAQIQKLNVYDAIFNWNILQDLGWDIFKSGTVWHSGLTLKDTWLIYIKNIPWYLWVKINMFYAYSLYLWPQLFLSILALVILFNKNISSIFSEEKKNFLLMLIVSGWIFSGAVILSVNGVQARYIISSNILLWFASLYTIYRFKMFYRVVIIKK